MKGNFVARVVVVCLYFLLLAAFFLSAFVFPEVKGLDSDPSTNWHVDMGSSWVVNYGYLMSYADDEHNFVRQLENLSRPFIVEAKMKPIEQTAEALGIFWCSGENPDTDRYQFAIGGWGNTKAFVMKKVASAETVFNSSYSFVMTQDVSYVLKAKVYASYFECYVDDVLVYNETDTDFSFGYSGLYVSTQQEWAETDYFREADIANTETFSDEFNYWYEVSIPESLNGWTWIREASNPIITNTTGSWDSLIAGDPSVIQLENGTWLMAYYGYDGVETKIGLAVSEDLVTWTKTGSIIDEGTKPSLLKMGTVSYCYITSGNKIKLYVSDENFDTWTDQGIVLSNGTSGEWDEGLLEASYILNRNGIPTTVDGKYWMFYYGENSTSLSKKIGVATSTNLISWTKYSGNPVFLPNPKFEDVSRPQANMASMEVFQLGSEFYMIYNFGDRETSYLGDENGAWFLGIASSSNLLAWNRHPHAVVTPTFDSGWEGKRIYAPCIVYPSVASNTFYLFYNAMDENNVEQIGLITFEASTTTAYTTTTYTGTSTITQLTTSSSVTSTVTSTSTSSQTYTMSTSQTSYILGENLEDYYFRSDARETNGVHGYSLETENSDLHNSFLVFHEGNSVTYAFDVYLTRYPNFTFPIGEKIAEITVSGITEGYESAMWTAPQTGLIVGYDGLMVVAYAKVGSGAYTAKAVYVTPLLVSSQLESSTWTFKIYVDYDVVTSTVFFGSSTYASGIQDVSLREPTENELQSFRWAQGDLLSMIFGAYTDEIGSAAYLLILLIPTATLYLRHRNTNVVVFMFILFGGPGGLVWFLVPMWAAIIVDLFLVLGYAVLLFKVIR